MKTEENDKIKRSVKFREADPESEQSCSNCLSINFCKTYCKLSGFWFRQASSKSVCREWQPEEVFKDAEISS